jgi:pimeloyl-ACP methyl ester carboxylesterase
MATHRFITTRDGVRIAYAEHGSGPPLVFVRGWLSHLDAMWQRPQFREFMAVLGSRFRVYRYDMRGNGLSQRDIGKISLASLVAELGDLVGELGLDRFTLYATSFGGPTAISYAAANPTRVESLILDGTYARGSEITAPARRWLLVLALRFFPEMAFLLLSNATHPNPGRSAQRTLEMGEQMVTPKTGSRFYALAFATDVSKVLDEVAVPTLVMHRSRSRSIPLRLGREVARRISGAEFVELGGEEHNSWEGDVDETLCTLSRFLNVDLARASLSDADVIPIAANVPGVAFVFVSYAHADQTEVEDVMAHIRSHGMRVWSDFEITPGAEWRAQVARAVQTCSAFVLCVSRASLESRHCVQEISFAVDEGRPILVVYLKQVDLPVSLRMALNQRQAIFKFKETSESFRKKLELGLRQLVAGS